MQKIRNTRPQVTNTVAFSTSSIDIPEFFDLSVSCNSFDTEITMFVLDNYITTHHMKHIIPVLRRYLPTILSSQCFNDNNIPFYQEVTQTELGHLFEHILLEYLCQGKIHAGSREAIFSGVTRWNWDKDKVGTFHITVDVCREDKELLYFALEQSILLLKRILSYQAFSPSTFILSSFAATSFASRSEKQMA